MLSAGSNPLDVSWSSPSAVEPMMSAICVQTCRTSPPQTGTITFFLVEHVPRHTTPSADKTRKFWESFFFSSKKEYFPKVLEAIVLVAPSVIGYHRLSLFVLCFWIYLFLFFDCADDCVVFFIFSGVLSYVFSALYLGFHLSLFDVPKNNEQQQKSSGMYCF